MTRFLDGGCEVQGNFIINVFRLIGVSSLRVRFVRRGIVLEMLQSFFSRRGLSSVVLYAMN